MTSQSYSPTFPEISNIVFSAKHDSLYLYVARLLRSVWKKRCIHPNFCSTITQEDCNVILDDLYAIRNFLTVNSVSEITGGKNNFHNKFLMIDNMCFYDNF